VVVVLPATFGLSHVARMAAARSGKGRVAPLFLCLMRLIALGDLGDRLPVVLCLLPVDVFVAEWLRNLGGGLLYLLAGC
jgi:hypothetical protein